MGDVYVAVQEPLGRQVALKLMRAGLVGPAAQRFEREAKSLAATTHPNIVTIFDYGRTDEGELFMAMELVRGVTLREHMARVGRLSPGEALPIVVDICRALEATHRAGIVHRDLKPENVMLVDVTAGTGGAASTAKVLDFGIARLHDPSGVDDAPKLTQTGHLVGTPGYMAPETVLEAVFDDPRSDLYAVGVITWELLTNRSLFQAPTPIALVMKHALDPPPTLTATLSLTTPPHPAVEALLAGLLHKDRHQRFASATAVIEAIAAMPPASLAPIATSELRAPIVNIDPSAPTMASTRGTIPTPAVVARSSSSIASSSSSSASVVVAPAPARPAPWRAVVAVVAVVVVIAGLAFAMTKPPVPTAPTMPTAPVPVVVTPAPVSTPVVTPAPVPAPAIVAPTAPKKPRPKPTTPSKPTSPVPHVPDLD